MMKGVNNMHCCSKVWPSVIHPTKCCTNHTCSNNIVPHIHPSHTTNVHHEHFQHNHYFPQTQSNVTDVTHQHFAAPPAQVSPFMGAPGPGFPGGFGPRPRPGFFGR